MYDAYFLIADVCMILTTVTALRLGATIPFRSTHTGVVSFDNSHHIGHATVANFYRISIKQFL